MYFAVAAHSVATTGYDPAGHWLPVYFPIGPVAQPLMWFQPLLMYAMAAVLWVLPVTEAAIRLPMALAGVANVLLMWAAARQLTKRDGIAAAAAVLLALSPAHFVFSRSGVDYLLPVTFILGWLWLALRYADTGERRDLIGASLCLGIGLYSLIASYILMPIYACLTLALVRQRRDRLSSYGLVMGTLALCAVPGLAFLATHPEMARTVMGRYDPASAAAGTFVSSRLANLSVFWSFWDPELLAINGGRMLTGAGGVFILAAVAPAAIGAVRALAERNALSVVLLGGLLVSPLPASLVNEPGAIRRALAMLPFVILLSAYGLDWVGSAASATRRIAFVAGFMFLVYLAAAYRPQLPLAQGYIRAATWPLAIVAMAMLYRRARLSARLARAGWAVVTLSVAVAFVYFYVDFLFVHRVGVVPATLIVWAYRLLLAAGIGALAVLLTTQCGRLGAARHVAIGVGLVVLPVAYFHVGAFTDMAPRTLHVALVATGTIALANALRGAAIARHRMREIATVSVLAIAALQFALFYADYRGDYLARHAGDEGNVMEAFDALLGRTDLGAEPVFYVSVPMERPDVRDIFWEYALIKHGREALLDHTRSEAGAELDPAVVAALPAGAWIMSGSTPASVQALQHLLDRGIVVDFTTVLDPGGRILARIVRRAGA